MALDCTPQIAIDDAEIEESFDDCAEGLILADMLGLDAVGRPMASR